MIRIVLNIELNYVVDTQGADFVFNIHAAHTACQAVSGEQLSISQPVDARAHRSGQR